MLRRARPRSDPRVDPMDHADECDRYPIAIEGDAIYVDLERVIPGPEPGSESPWSPPDLSASTSATGRGLARRGAVAASERPTLLSARVPRSSRSGPRERAHTRPCARVPRHPRYLADKRALTRAQGVPRTQ